MLKQMLPEVSFAHKSANEITVPCFGAETGSITDTLQKQADIFGLQKYGNINSYGRCKLNAELNLMKYTVLEKLILM
jgi:hypothetical protein